MLTIRRTKVFRGPSIWAQQPVIMMVVAAGGLEEQVREVPSEPVNGGAVLVTSAEEPGKADPAGRSFPAQLPLEHVVLALQQQAGAEVTFAQTHPTASDNVYTVVYQYQHEDVGRAAGELAVRLLNHLLYQSEPGFAFAHELEASVLRRAKRHASGRTTSSIMAAAKRRDIPVFVLNQSPILLQLGTGKYQRRASNPSSDSVSPDFAVKTARNKDRTKRLLREAGLPVPEGAVARSADEAVQAAARIGYPVVLKPLDVTHGRGVSVDLGSAAKVHEFFPRALRETGSGRVIVERYVPGKDYRILVVGDQVAAVTERVPAHVIGDGTLTVTKLVERANADPRRGVGHEKILKRITVNEQTIEALSKQALTLEDVPEAGRHVQLKLTGNMSTGGTSIDRTDAIHPDNVAIARQAARIIGLDVAGIDVITPDITHSLLTSGGTIIELNGRPEMRMHVRPAEGTARDVGAAVVDMLFPPGQPSRVPIVAVTGTRGTTATTRLIAHFLTTAGTTVGMTTSDGLYVAGTRLLGGDRSGPRSARRVLRNPVVELAVLETTSRCILRDGLGFDRCDVAVVTAVHPDPPGRGGVSTMEEWTRILSVVPRTVAPGGTTILNADDAWTARVAQTAQGELLYYSLDDQHPLIQEHVGAEGRALVLRQTPSGAMLTLLAGGEATELLPAAAIPATMSGGHDVTLHDALAATAVAIVQGLPLETIRTALCTLAPRDGGLALGVST